jgi:hypothetical protein
MLKQWTSLRATWLVVGTLAGICMTSFWPSAPLSAVSTDRTEKFAMTTTPVENDLEAVFTLDFLTGRLTGAVLSNQGTGFAAYYFRNIAADFNVNPESKPSYAITAGRASLQQRGRAQWGASVIYVAELSSGRVAAYRIPYVTMNRKVPAPIELVPLDTFPFRGALQID